MIEVRIAQFGSTSDSTSRIASPTSVAEVLTGDEIKQINRDKEEDELDEDLDDIAAEEEQGDELEEEDEVETAAEANRG